MNFFEYLFCRLYWWNTKIIKENVAPIMYSISGLSMFQTLSVFPLYCIFYVFLFKSYYISGTLGFNPFLVIGVIVIVINILYFNKFRKYPVLLKNSIKFPKKRRKKWIFYVLFIS